MLNENESIQISIEKLDILTCTDEDYVYLKTSIVDYSSDKFDEETCAVILERTMLNNMLNEWLDGKQSYYKYGSWAGEGYFEVAEYIELEENERCHLNIFHGENDNEDEWYVEKKIVRTFLVTNYIMQMEHG